MSVFKDQIRDDLAIFLNLQELAEEADIDGVIRKVVIDDGQSGFSSSSKGDLNNASGISLIENSRTIYVEDTFEYRPVPGQILEINGETWQVEDSPNSVKIEMGLLALKLNRVWN